MLNLELAGIFNQMAEMLEFLGDPKDFFRARAYLNASLALKEASSETIKRLAVEKRLREISGIGEGIAAKIEEYVKTGKIKEYEHLKKLIPKGFFELLNVPSLGPKKIKMLNKELGVSNIEELKKAVQERFVKDLPGFGEKSAQKILKGIEISTRNKGRMLLGDVYLTVRQIAENLKKCEFVSAVEPAGSFRRAEETVGDIDILATGDDAEKIMKYFVAQPYVAEVEASGATKTTVITKDGLQVDLRVVKPNEFGSALQYFTGSKSHNIHLRTYAKSKGFKLSEYGFFKEGRLVASKTEEQCYKALGMQFIPPEMRLDAGEIQAALKRKIPKLIEAGDLKGDLHAHSTWSDGRDTIENMAKEAANRGFEYIAITDHSPSLSVTGGLSAVRLKEKKREIDRLNDKLGIKILFGTEVDILADGSLDYPNEILKNFDIVAASIHSRFNQDNTDRILKAIENPFVHIIGHPGGRMLGQREPYSLDYEKLFRACRDTGTVLEINSQYLRFDLTDEQIRAAKRWGCKFAINSDAHSASTLWYTELGVRWARRGWVEAKDALNTLAWEKLRKTLK